MAFRVSKFTNQHEHLRIENFVFTIIDYIVNINVNSQVHFDAQLSFLH